MKFLLTAINAKFIHSNPAIYTKTTLTLQVQTKLSRKRELQTVDKTLLVSTPEAFFLFSVQKVCT